MINKNIGIIIYLKKIKENDLFIKLLTFNDELISGVVYGGNSTKKKQNYQLGYVIDYNLFKKNTNRIASIKAELCPPFLGSIFEDKYKSLAILATVSLLNLSILEGQKITGLYKSSFELIDIISSKNKWLNDYCKWLFILLKQIGYEVNYEKNKNLKYFNLDKNDFENDNLSNNIITFPHEMLNKSIKINYIDVNAIFLIFENIYIKNHLNNYYNYKMPIHYTKFKNVVLNRIKNSNV